MPAPGVLVFERGQTRWEAALKREFAGELTVRPCKALVDVREQLVARPRSVVVVSLESGPETGAVLAWAASAPDALVLVISHPLGDEAERLLREIGVDSVLFEPVTEQTLSRACRKLLPTDRDDPLEALLSDDV